MFANLLLACAIVAGFLAVCVVLKFLIGIFSPVDNGTDIVTSDGTTFGAGKPRRVKNSRHYANWH